MRILAVDPGEKRIGVAISDPSHTIANPLTILTHKSRKADAAAILNLASDQNAELIIIGQALNADGIATYQSKRAERLAGEIRSNTHIDVILWDESGSTQAVRDAQISMGVSRRKRRSHVDNIAAAFILQTFLDSSEITELLKSESES
jgi:putative Holliday junction resolvase